jgi:hypothetical protein
MIEIRLTPEQVAQADAGAINQSEVSRAAGRRDRVVNQTKYAGDAGVRKHKIGARGEAAVAAYVAVEWSAQNDTFGSVPDVREAHNGFDVRTRASFRFGWPVRPSDRHDERILVCCDLPDLDDNLVLLQGWTVIGEVKTHPEWLASPGGGSQAWFVPLEALNPMETLPGHER